MSSWKLKHGIIIKNLPISAYLLALCSSFSYINGKENALTFHGTDTKATFRGERLVLPLYLTTSFCVLNIVIA